VKKNVNVKNDYKIFSTAKTRNSAG